MAVLRFGPPLGGLGATYDVKLRLIGKRFLLVSIDFFSLGVTAEAFRANIDRKSAFSLRQDQFGPKFQIEGIAYSRDPYTDFYLL